MASQFFLLLEKFGCQYQNAFQQLQVIDKQITETEIRLKRAKKNGCYYMNPTLSLRLNVLEEVRALFYEFTSIKAEDLVQLQENAGLVDVPENCDVAYDSDMDDSDVEN